VKDSLKAGVKVPVKGIMEYVSGEIAGKASAISVILRTIIFHYGAQADGVTVRMRAGSAGGGSLPAHGISIPPRSTPIRIPTSRQS
jgi:hypothetical protein